MVLERLNLGGSQMRIKDAAAKERFVSQLSAQGKFGFYNIFPNSSCKVFLYSKKLEVPFEPAL